VIEPTAQPPSPVAPATGKKIRASKKVQGGFLFLTANTHKRIPVFREPVLCEVFFRELDFYRNRYGFLLHAYVLLPDHFHLLLDFPPQKSFASFLRDFKSAIGRLVVDWLKENRRIALIEQLQLARPPMRRKDARFCVLQPNSYVRAVTSRTMFKQKLDYIHANPVREGLVERAVNYPYSSLRSYELGGGPIRIDPHNLILD